MASRHLKKQNHFLVAPSLLSADFSCLKKEIKALEKAGADALHLDIMDGHFVPNITLGPSQVQALRKVTDLVFDVHLMIENPERYIHDFIKAGADYLTFHIETLKDPQAVISSVKEQGCCVGLTLKPQTPFSEMTPFLDHVDLVLVMTVEPGFGGQKFLKEQTSKIRNLKALNKDFLIEVDGGVNSQTALDCVDCDILVSGSFIFQSEDYQVPIEQLKAIRRPVL